MEYLKHIPIKNDQAIIDKYIVPSNLNHTTYHIRILNGFANERNEHIPTPLHFYQCGEQDKLGIERNSFEWEAGSKYCKKILLCYNVSLEKGNQEENVKFLFELLKKNYFIDLSLTKIWSPTFIISFEKSFNQFYQEMLFQGFNTYLDLPPIPKQYSTLSNKFWVRKSFPEDIYQTITSLFD